MSDAVKTFANSIATKLYFVALLSLLAMAILATASIYFSQITENAAKRLYGDGFVEVTNAAQLELLFQHHRRIVESMPAEADRQRIQSDRNELRQLQARLLELANEIVARSTGSSLGNLAERIAATLPRLSIEADRVAMFAYEFAQDKAAESADEYSRTAATVHKLVTRLRELRMRDAQRAISDVREASSALIWAVLLCVVLASILIGPIQLVIMHKVLSRLRRVTRAMAQVANNQTTISVPSRDDLDEVGEMARAVEVFKSNAIQLISREIELKHLNRRIEIALNNMTHGLCMFDVEQKLIICNKQYARMYALPPELCKPGTTVEEIYSYRRAAGNGPRASSDRFDTTAASSATPVSTFTQELADGRIIAVSERPMGEGGSVAIHEDVTERRRAEAKITYMARHDMLTDLPNRFWFIEHLQKTIGSLQPGCRCAVHCLDLDNFKTVNDSLGHLFGDKILKLVSRRLRKILPTSAFVARIGGDEFAIVQAGMNETQQCHELASLVIKTISEPYDIDGKHIVIGTSIGIAIAPEHGTDPDQLLKNADMALYVAKDEGRGVHHIFQREMDERLQSRHLLELDLRNAVVNGEFELHYQPIMTLKNRQIVGFEALVRWNHPQRGQIAPSEFIPLAEQTGLILPLGEWVMRTACSHAAKWPEPVGLAVNLSAIQFRSPSLVQMTMNALASSGLPPHHLDLEITESVLLQDEINILAVLHQLRDIGIHISLDDFGTGYSSLSYLRNFPFDKIKIDKSFVQDMLVRKDCQAIVRAVIGLAESLGIPTIIEGIETDEQLEAARADGCDQGQGYLLGRPMPNSDVAAFLERHAVVRRAA